jgi:hypothetical protein
MHSPKERSFAMPQQQPEKVVTVSMVNGLPVPDQDPVEVKQANQKVR